MRHIDHGAGALWEKTTVVDEEAVDHERFFGVVLLENEEVLVRVAQRVDFDLLATPMTAQLHRPRITLGGAFELTPPQARETAGRLTLAADFADTVGATPHTYGRPSGPSASRLSLMARRFW
jgi:hypothetical protein